MEVETWHEILHDKLRRLIQLHTFHNLLHAVQTWTLGTKYRITSLFRCFPQRLFQFGTLTVGNVEHTLRLPNLSAAHLLHALREYGLIARLRHQLYDFVHEVVNLATMLRLTHRLINTAGEVDDLERTRRWNGGRGMRRNALFDDELREVRRLWLTVLFRHGGSP